MKIGLIGEAPHDTFAIQKLLSQQYDSFDFVTLINDIHGSELDSSKTKRFLRYEYLDQKPDLIIFIRDLDGLESDSKAKNRRKQYFTAFNRTVDKCGIFLLHIYEIEALILADIESFNDLYQCSIGKPEDPMLIPEPKEFLKNQTYKLPTPYKETHNSEIFKLLRFNIVKQNCRYFNTFIKKFDKELSKLG